MNVFRRSLLYMKRKKGQTVTLFTLFCLISAFLLICFSILAAADTAAKELRTSIGGAFYLRPASGFDLEDGKMIRSEGGTSAITDDNIREIMEGGNIKYCNALNYGYAKSDALDFIPGEGFNDGSNMGKVAAMNYTSLADQFIENKLELIEGRHLTKKDKNKILISEELALANQLKVGDRVKFTHAGLNKADGEYQDSIPIKNAFSEAEIVGIYKDKTGQPGEAGTPTPGRKENLIFSDHNFLVELNEQKEGEYKGEVNFYVSDPLLLKEIISKVEKMETIDWGDFALRENDFQYKEIAGSLGAIQHLIRILIVCASAASMAVLILILTMRIRGRVHEAGILLAIGKTKKEIAGQFVAEVLGVFLAAFLCSAVLSYLTADGIDNMVFGGLLKTSIDIGAIETGIAKGTEVKQYLQLDGSLALLLLLGQGVAVTAAVVLSSFKVMSLKPKEILTKMS